MNNIQLQTRNDSDIAILLPIKYFSNMNGEKAESIPLASWVSWSKSQISFSYKFWGIHVVIQLFWFLASNFIPFVSSHNHLLAYPLSKQNIITFGTKHNKIKRITLKYTTHRHFPRGLYIKSWQVHSFNNGCLFNILWLNNVRLFRLLYFVNTISWQEKDVALFTIMF